MKNHLYFLVLIAIWFLPFCQSSAPTEIANNQATETKESIRDVFGLKVKRGLIKNTSAATPGYLLFSPTNSTATYLMNLEGKIVHEWKGDIYAGVAYLKENGNLVRVERDPDLPVFAAGGLGGRTREYTWDGELIWDFKYADEQFLTHHDIAIMPNGNILAISYEVKSAEEVRAAGHHPEAIPKAGLWPDKIIEIEPQPPNSGKIVWEWHFWDHIVQEYDKNLANYGVLSENPRKINLNVYHSRPPMTAEKLQQLKDSGQMTSNTTLENRGSDMTHVNAINYNATLDQIAISFPEHGEFFIIDHSTTTEEAKGNTGGRWGHGGDLLYRWGNPANYGRGTKADQHLFNNHDIRWIPEGMPGAGNLLIFNNEQPGGAGKFSSIFSAIGANQTPFLSIGDLDNYSQVLELTLPTDTEGNYLLPENAAFGPTKPTWQYMSRDKYSFYAPFVSGAQRLKNGHTLINAGPRGQFIEVTSTGDIVWEYWNPYVGDYLLPDGSPAQQGGPFIYLQFRVNHFATNFPAFEGRELSPVQPQPAVYVPKAASE